MSAELTAERSNRPGISVFGGEGLELERVLARHSIPHPKVRTTTAGRLREADFEIEQTGRPGHFTIWLPDMTDNALVRLVAAFDPPVTNPYSRRGRKPSP